MALHLVIDGYNLIRQSNSLAAAERRDIQAGREALVDLLAAYKRVKSYRITVVFDGAQAPLGMPRRDRCKGIEVCYSPPGVLADTVIKRMAANGKAGTMVVTSDQDIIAHARSVGAATISAGEFENRLAMARFLSEGGAEGEDDTVGWQPSTQKKGPARRLPKRQRRNRRKVAKL
jgi:predicted RNA-binding protein with PIN domain